jgi:membrane-associated phospholipid phosphatase
MTAIETGWGLDIILWFQAWRTPLMAALGTVFHYLGSEQFYLVALPLIYWCVDEAFGRRLALFFLLASWSNSWLKALFHRPRPAQVSGDVHPAVEESGYGPPSGHSQNAAALWGVVAYRVRRAWVTVGVVAYVLLVMLSRMVVGVHYLHDVVLGALIGALLVGAYAWGEPRVSRWLKEQKLLAQIGLAVLVTAVLLGISLVTYATPATMEGAGTPLGAFMGMGIGFALEGRYVRFRADGLWWKRVLRFLLGTIGVLALWQGLSIAFEGLEPALAFRLIRYGLVGLWGAFGAPWVFVRIGLAEVKS